MEPGDAEPPAMPVAAPPVDDTASEVRALPTDRASRRAALRDLAALIGVEVFY